MGVVRCEREQEVHGLDRDQQQRVLPEDQRRGHAQRYGRAGQRLLLPQLRGPAEPAEQRWAQLRGPDPSAERRVLQGEVPGFRGQCKGWTVTNNGECYLKDSVGPMRPDGGVQASGNCQPCAANAFAPRSSREVSCPRRSGPTAVANSAQPRTECMSGRFCAGPPQLGVQTSTGKKK